MSKSIAQVAAQSVDYFNAESAADSVLGQVTPDLHFTAARNSDQTATVRFYERREGHAGMVNVDTLTVVLKASNNSLAVIAGLEYFLFNDELYRARVSNPLDANGYRMGARWQAPAHLADDFFQMVASA